MAKKTPQEAAEKWAKNTKGATQEMTRGIQKVTEAPGAAAAAKQDKLRQNLVSKIDDGTWAERVASVTLGEWKDKMLNKGVGRVAAGVDGAGSKVIDFHGQRADHQERIETELKNMPDVTLEDGINRMVHQVRRMSEFKFRR